MDEFLKGPRRPEYLPPGIDYEALSDELKRTLDAIVLPVYGELVLLSNAGLERAAGQTIVFLLLAEVFHQHELGPQMHPLQAASANREERDRDWQRHLKLLGAKQTAVNSLLKLRKLYAQPLFPLPPRSQ